MVNKQYIVQNQPTRNSTSSENIRYPRPTASAHNLKQPTISNNLDLTTDSVTRNYMRDANVCPYTSSHTNNSSSDSSSDNGVSLNGSKGLTHQEGYRDKEVADINKIGRFQYIVQMDHEMVRDKYKV